VTIVTCVKVRDGLVLGTDSMAHIQREGAFLRSFEHATKLFQVRDLPMGVMSYGLGNVGHRSIESLMREFSGKLKKDLKTVDAVGKALFKFMKKEYDAHAEALPEGEELPALGFYLAGYSPGQVFAEEREFTLPESKKPSTPIEKEEFGATWRGVHAPFWRLSMGYGLLVRARLDDLQINVVFDGMPVQDAVDYAVFILNTTIGYTTFSMQLSACGGPLQIATILPDGGFKWLAKPELKIKGPDV